MIRVLRPLESIRYPYYELVNLSVNAFRQSMGFTEK